MAKQRRTGHTQHQEEKRKSAFLETLEHIWDRVQRPLTMSWGSFICSLVAIGLAIFLKTRSNPNANIKEMKKDMKEIHEIFNQMKIHTDNIEEEVNILIGLDSEVSKAVEIQKELIYKILHHKSKEEINSSFDSLNVSAVKINQMSKNLPQVQ